MPQQTACKSLDRNHASRYDDQAIAAEPAPTDRSHDTGRSGSAKTRRAHPDEGLEPVANGDLKDDFPYAKVDVLLPLGCTQ